MDENRKILDAITATLQNYPAVKKAVLFGSRARGDHHARSDYDVAVYGALDRQSMRAIRFALEELPTLHKIDLVFMQEVSDAALTANIAREGICFYGQADK